MDPALKKAFLEELGFTTDGTWIFDSTSAKVHDKYSGVPVRFDHMMILPGSTIILDDDPLSLILYCKEYGHRLDELVGSA